MCGMRRFWAGRGNKSEGGEIKHIKKRVEVLCVVRAHLVGKRGCMRRIGISFGRGGGRGGTGEEKKKRK